MYESFQVLKRQNIEVMDTTCCPLTWLSKTFLLNTALGLRFQSHSEVVFTFITLTFSLHFRAAMYRILIICVRLKQEHFSTLRKVQLLFYCRSAVLVASLKRHVSMICCIRGSSELEVPEAIQVHDGI